MSATRVREKLLTVALASESSGIPYGTLLRLIHEGSLRAVELPGRRRYFIDPVDLDALIEGSKSGSFPGSIDDSEPVKTRENPALLQKSHAAAKSIKPLWYEKYARK